MEFRDSHAIGHGQQNDSIPQGIGYQRRNGFPPRSKMERMIVQILLEHNGRVGIQNVGGRTIYEELAIRLGVSPEACSRRTEGTRERAWRPEVGYCRKNLVERGVLRPTEPRKRGVWELSATPHSATASPQL